MYHDYGWVPQLPDQRDLLLPLALPDVEIPSSVDLRNHMPPIGNQGQLGSCTAWASTAAYRYELDRLGLPDFEPSELAHYYWTRSLEGTTRSDAGASIRDAVKTLAKVGVVEQSAWPYDVAMFSKAPPASVKRSAKRHIALQYQAVMQSFTALQSALAAGLPVVVGISVYASFETPQVERTGDVPMPLHREQLLGGHAVVVVGYDNATAKWLVRNSWGPSWGMAGYFHLPYAYLTNPGLSSDFWTVSKVD